MNEKICENCKKTYMPKSNNSKYCSRICNSQAYNKRRTERYKTNKQYREQISKYKSERFKYKYHNEPGYKEKHNQQTIKQRRDNPISWEKHLKYSRKRYKNKYKNNPEFKEKQKQRSKENYRKDKEKILKRNSEWRKSEDGRIADAKHRNKRRRQLKFVPILTNPFPKEIPVDYHHINDILTIPIPKQTHQYVNGRKNGDKEEHLKHNKKWIEKIYCFDVDLLK